VVNKIILGRVSLRAHRFFPLFFHQWFIFSIVTTGLNKPIFIVVASATHQALHQSAAFWERCELWGRNCLLVAVMSLIQGLPVFYLNTNIITNLIPSSDGRTFYKSSVPPNFLSFSAASPPSTATTTVTVTVS
jgi:hypothetical protein